MHGKHTDADILYGCCAAARTQTSDTDISTVAVNTEYHIYDCQRPGGWYNTEDGDDPNELGVFLPDVDLGGGFVVDCVVGLFAFLRAVDQLHRKVFWMGLVRSIGH